MHNALLPLITALKKKKALSGVSALLSWDQETYMPEGSIEQRAEQLALIDSISHAHHTSHDFKSAMAEVVDLKTGLPRIDGLTESEKTMVKAVWRDWQKTNALPTAFVEELSKATALGQHQWGIAREQNKFLDFAPHLQKMVELQRKKAVFYNMEGHAYDALIDDYEPGMKMADINPLFDALRDAIIDIRKRIETSKATFVDISESHYDITKQWDFGVDILNEMGFDFKRGRQDKSVHPFTTEFNRNDVRITTRFNPNDLLESFSSTIHEGGHALYEQGLDAYWDGTPLAEAMSLGIHESQSLLWENYVCYSWPFWDGHFNKLKQYFRYEFTGVSAEQFYRTINQVQPSCIRVEADEVTYSLHIMLRYEIEKALISGDLDVAELPTLWNQRMADYVGITPPNDTQGVLQDVHWSYGLFGYFPTYALGNLYGRMLFEQAESEIPDLNGSIRRGEMLALKTWLNDKVHKVGRGTTPSELITHITGKELSVTPFVNYLKEKYGAIYKVKL
ncbi:MAG: carboxypeptidase M32 [bacterium]|nr:carboxypeptidase M32 [bacterium]